MPVGAQRAYYVYLLDFGWEEAFGDAVRRNLPRMADAASRSDAVVIHGPRGVHFEDEDLSWHHLNRQPGEEVLPALMITTRHPVTIRDSYGPARGGRVPPDALVLIPLRKVCGSPEAVVDLIARVFRDIAEKKALPDFQVMREMRRGVGGALVDSLILEPKIGGVGINLKKLAQFFKSMKGPAR